jgi:hypothetical protein
MFMDQNHILQYTGETRQICSMKNKDYFIGEAFVEDVIPAKSPLGNRR